MSAEVLREAAALMRERAEDATPGPWFALSASAIFNPSVATRPGSVDDLESSQWVAEASPSRDSGKGDSDAEYIASWHPAVALAVADWLEDEADNLMPDTIAHQINLGMSPEDAAGMAEILHRPALAVARAYLGRDA